MKPDTAWTFGMLVAGVLILCFLWKALVPGGEWPLSPAHYLAMALDAGLLVVLISRISPMSAANQAAVHPVFTRVMTVAGVLAGIGLLVIRFTSDQAWWTGHLRTSVPF